MLCDAQVKKRGRITAMISGSLDERLDQISTTDELSQNATICRLVRDGAQTEIAANRANASLMLMCKSRYDGGHAVENQDAPNCPPIPMPDASVKN